MASTTPTHRRAGLVSDDGWNWRRGIQPSRSGLAPDVIHLGDRYYMFVARNVGAQPRAEVNMIWSKTLDPNSPNYKWEEGGVVASSDGAEDCNAIDPGLLLDPTDGKLWLTYVSYFGYIRLVQLDPKTGKRVDPNDKPVDIAINCEASVMIYHDGWYYLLATHGSCCRGADSGYNIRVGRSKKVTGPFLDDEGVDMHQGGETVRRLGRSRRGGWAFWAWIWVMAFKVLLPLRSRSRSRRFQRADIRPPLEGWLAGGQ
jgi:arabinan endo-1,5-alpha-L-arabinosidase